MVYRAGDDVVRLFEGQDPDHPEITFLGITNHSIRRYLLERGLSQVADLTPEFCKKVLLCHVLDGKLWRDSIPLGEDSQGGNLIKGGAYYTTLGGTRLAMHTLLKLEDVVSTNIEPDHSLVHAMAYYYDWTNMSDDLR